jgi:hypothetical protein
LRISFLQLMLEIRQQEQAEKLKGREMSLAISEAVAATRSVNRGLSKDDLI